MVYKFNFDNEYNNVKTCLIKYISQKVTSVGKNSDIADFLNKNIDEYKILVVSDISKKAKQYILSTYKNTEVFMEQNMMINLIEHELVPEHRILSSEEAEEFLEKYNCKKRNLPRMLLSDPVAEYYNAKIGDIFRIIRPNEASGYAPAYRIVVKGSIK